MSIFLAEIFGTFLLILLGNGVVANALLSRSKGEKGGWIVITAGWGFAVAVAVYTIGWISGGHINPAVTFGFALTGRTPWSMVPVYWVGQMIGAMLGALFVWLSYYSHWKLTRNPTLKLLCFCTKPVVRNTKWNFLTEVVATAILLIGILGMLDPNTNLGMGMAPYMIGVLVWSIGLSLGGPTGFAINPARDLGPRLMHHFLPIAGKGNSDWSYAWVPITGPLLGSALGVILYRIFTS